MLFLLFTHAWMNSLGLFILNPRSMVWHQFWNEPVVGRLALGSFLVLAFGSGATLSLIECVACLVDRQSPFRKMRAALHAFLFALYGAHGVLLIYRVTSIFLILGPMPG